MKSDSDSDKYLLSKGLNLLPASLEYSEYLVDFELFFRDMLSLEPPTLTVSYLKVDLRT